MTETDPRVFLRLSDVYGVTDDELRAVLGGGLNIVGITRGSPSVRYADEECAVVTLRGDRRSIKAHVEPRFKAFRHPERQPHPDFDFKGLTPLTNGQLISEEKNIIDVIAVAGLGGNAFATWQGDKPHHLSHWLRDFLPIDIENVRVWIYGYKSDLSDDDNMANTLHFADLLRDELVTAAERYNMRNIILMGHSLGGILIKKALVDLPRNDEFFGWLIALVFFGAPHRGFEITALSDYAFTTLRQQRAKTMIAELGSDSAFLGGLNNDFIDRLDSSLPHIITVYETRKTHTLIQNPASGNWTRTGPLVEAVPLSSARLGLQTKYETLLSAPYDHSGIAKVTKDEEHVYKRLLRQLNKHIKKRNPGSSSATSAGSLATTNSSSLGPNMNVSQNLLLHQATGSSSSDTDTIMMNTYPAGRMETLIALPDNSWTQVPPGLIDQQTAAMLRAAQTNPFLDPRRLAILANSHNVSSHILPDRTRVTPDSSDSPEHPVLGRVQTLSAASTRFEGAMSKPQSEVLAESSQRPVRLPPPPPPRRPLPSVLSTIYPVAGHGVNPHLAQQNNPFLIPNPAVTSPQLIRNGSPEQQAIQPPSSRQTVWPEPVERLDQPEALRSGIVSLPFISFRQAPSVPDYRPFNVEKITRYLHDPSLLVTMKRYFTTAIWDSDSVEPMMFKSDVISDPHCECSYSDGQWFIRDLGSMNGTWLNGIRLSESTVVSLYYALRDRDLLKLGRQDGVGRRMEQRCVRLVVDFSDD